ncbi:MAG TPA: hypothetical protein VF192_02530 [Longimicrobiales bacterium]
MPGEDERLAEEVSRLYWETGASVGEIATQLDISRRALYAALQPFPAGERCPECGEGLVFMTRSARDEGAAECPACGFEQRIAGAIGAAGESGTRTASAAGGGQVEGDEAAPTFRAPGPAAAPGAPRGALIGAAVLGVVAGVVGTLWLRRR